MLFKAIKISFLNIISFVVYAVFEKLANDKVAKGNNKGFVTKGICCIFCNI